VIECFFCCFDSLSAFYNIYIYIYIYIYIEVRQGFHAFPAWPYKMRGREERMFFTKNGETCTEL
jgi:hypothetical protein